MSLRQSITGVREAVLRACYAGIKQLLRGAAPHSPPRTVEQGSNRASAPQMLQGSTALLLYCFGVRWGSGGGAEAVAHVAHGLDERVVAVLDLAPQPPDVDVHRAGATVEIVPPHLVQKRLAVQDAVGVRGQEAEGLVFLVGQVRGRGGPPGGG